VVRWLIEALVELGHVVTLLLAGIWRPGCAHDFRLPTGLLQPRGWRRPPERFHSE